MAWPMYAPYVQRRLVQGGMPPGQALKHVLDRTDIATHRLLQEIEERPVIYSRSPAWHPFNVVAGKAKLIQGDAIAVNPYITTGMNMDFDGDQINVHVPAQEDAVKDAREKLMASKMLFSIKDWERTVPEPKQEAVLGLYTALRRPAKTTHVFGSRDEALAAVRGGKVPLSDDLEFPD
jgi:DNA-directed RNA polymerase beta' subunit